MVSIVRLQEKHEVHEDSSRLQPVQGDVEHAGDTQYKVGKHTLVPSPQ